MTVQNNVSCVFDKPGLMGGTVKCVPGDDLLYHLLMLSPVGQVVAKLLGGAAVLHCKAAINSSSVN